MMSMARKTAAAISDASTAMMAITTSSSMSVKALRRSCLLRFLMTSTSLPGAQQGPVEIGLVVGAVAALRVDARRCLARPVRAAGAVPAVAPRADDLVRILVDEAGLGVAVGEDT